MGMDAKCPQCGHSTAADTHRGARLGPCPECGAQLQGWTAGKARGRYRCPITGKVVTLGLRAAVQLTGPMRLAFQPGTDWTGKKQVTDPSQLSEYRQADWERAAGRVFGPGCVVMSAFSLPQPGEYGYGEACLYLAPAADAGPAEWYVNQPVTYRKCAACSARVVADDASRMDREWTPARSWYWAAHGRRARTADTDPGPHPPGTYACPGCRGEDQ